MSFGTQVGLAPGHFVLDGAAAPHPRKGAQQPPTFRRMFKLVVQGSRLYAVVKYIITYHRVVVAR